MQTYDFTIETLGPCKVHSPIELSTKHGNLRATYVTDNSYVRNEINVFEDSEKTDGLNLTNLMQKAGPREYIYFNPAHVTAGICTCGGLCPGLNDVIRAIVRCLYYRYGVKKIRGFRFGFKGFFPESGFGTIDLNPSVVDDIHKIGGSFLGTSRGGGNRVNDIVDSVESLSINMLFIIGGDGTQRGALDIANEIEKRGLKVAVVGIPKTVDNDLLFIDRSFGFETAVERACEAVRAIHMEASSQINGIGLVKLMGRESGFIATGTALGSHETNFCLIPEIPFELDGPNGFMHHLEKRILDRHHAVVIVAEGAGQDLLATSGETDASGNKKLADVGIFLRDKINEYFKSRNIHINLKYVDPSYQIRSSETTSNDSIYCERLGSYAVHAAMAGKTKMVVGLVNNKYVHIPIKMVTMERNFVDPESALWRDALDATRQPIIMVNNLNSISDKVKSGEGDLD
ncbi:ATP-dependent 6-phosphofructokinase [Treponema pectinovorum]|uniref:ATP-dependent 6-phosphofructokinase n=1 Tax=Treponema pectinovorum TaxID=164 RepID=UPI0011C8E361|nr:ATP-dependent 6-phosphofructokinase [Treponema pectinovorum]